MKKRWIVKPSGDVTDLVGSLGLHPITAQLLLNRGIHTLDAASKFLAPAISDLPNPSLFAGIKVASTRIAKAIEDKEKIAVYGDYDVDGTTGTALLTLFLRGVGADVVPYIPHRLKEGYGLNREALSLLHEKGCTLVVTVDTGTTAVDSAEHANSIGLDLIITDHHRPHGDLPAALAVINPFHPNSEYPDLSLSGVGMAFNLAASVRQVLREKGWFATRPMPNLKQTLDLVALGTVADIVALQGVNRVFVSHGLPLISEGRRVGIRAILKTANLKGEVTPSHLGFVFGPRINAGGRLEDATIGLRLLMTEDEGEAAELASTLESLNNERRAIQNSIFEEALSQLELDPLNLERKVSVVIGENWHAGVIGIVASKLIEKYFRPTIVFSKQSDGTAKGSVRSILGIDLPTVLTKCEEFIVEWGGHAAAAGLTLKPAVFEQFRTSFDKAVKANSTDETFIPIVEADSSFEPADISEGLLKELDLLRPFGFGNPEPLFLINKLRVVSKRIVGEKHLKIVVRSSDQLLEAIAFNKGQLLDTLDRDVALAYTPEINIWNGRRTIQLKIKDIRDC